MEGRLTLFMPGKPTFISPGNFCWLSDAQTLHAISPQEARYEWSPGGRALQQQRGHYTV